MPKNILTIASFFAAFWLIFLLLQNETIHKITFGKISDTWVDSVDGKKLVNAPFKKLTNENYVQWDGVHYHTIKNTGYDIEKANGDYIFAFFPLYPLIWNISGLPPIGMIFINYLLFGIALLILYKIFGTNKSLLRNTPLLIAFSIPTLVVFLIPYTESTFLLAGAIGLYGLTKKKYWIYFVGFFLCALTRPTYTFLMLSLIGAEVFFLLGHKQILSTIKSTFFKLLPLGLGTLTVSIVHKSYSGGGFFKFVEVQKYWDHVLSIPHGIRDWSHEGFGMSLGIIFIFAIPLFAILLLLFYNQLVGSIKKSMVSIFDNTPNNYIQVLSIFYIVGIFLFILLFQGGSLNGLSRYVLCTPFFFSLLFFSFNYISKIDASYRFFFFITLSLFSVFSLGLIDYSTQWNFSDTGMFLTIALFFFWLFQDLSQSKIYKVGLYSTVFVNVVWTAYLFNTYISNGWIFT